MPNSLLERFLTYTKIDTTADGNSSSCPSTVGQRELGLLLARQLEQIGLSEVEVDDNGYVMATLPANCGYSVPTIGFIAHMDTSPDCSGAGVRPRVVTAYDGGTIVLSAEQGGVLSPEQFPELTNYLGQDLVVTDGTTLLGADDKAGIAEIVTAMAYLLDHPELKHGTVRICFTPDEEIGRGANRFDVARFGAEFAYTVDGGAVGELEYETFNAAEAVVHINGRSVHPGTAKQRMLNALKVALAFDDLLPAAEVPEHTADYEGFYHLHHLTGTVAAAELRYLIRDHAADRFGQRKQQLQRIAAYLNECYGTGTVTLIITDQYYNMREKIEPVFHIVELAQAAMVAVGVEPLLKPVRGGTDGARLSFMGLPCPNLFAGGHNFHGKYEFIPVAAMEQAVAVIREIIVRQALLYKPSANQEG